VKRFKRASTLFLLSLGSIPGPSTSNLSARAAEEKRTRFSIKGGFSLSQLEGGREGGRGRREGGREGGLGGKAEEKEGCLSDCRERNED
jgi:hypothetical protein